MNFKQPNNIPCTLMLMAVLLGGLGACSNMNSYKEYEKEGEITYPGRVDSVHLYPGKNRLKMTFFLPPDPTVTKAKVFWNTGKDSVEVPFPNNNSANSMSKIINNLEEGSHSFNVYTYDQEGHKSIVNSVVGQVYGETYSNSLLPRLIESALYLNGALRIVWNQPDSTEISNKITYTTTNGDTKVITVPPKSDTTIINDYDFNVNGKVDDEFHYATLYKPDSTVIDTFSTTPQIQNVFGEKIDYDSEKSSWTGSGSAYNDHSYYWKAFDNDLSTYWLSYAGHPAYYPHTIVMDTKTEKKQVIGFKFSFRTGAKYRTIPPGATGKIEVQVSSDSTHWKSLGEFPTQTDKRGYQTLVRFDQVVEPFRYFKFICLTRVNDRYAALAEVGLIGNRKR